MRRRRPAGRRALATFGSATGGTIPRYQLPKRLALTTVARERRAIAEDRGCGKRFTAMAISQIIRLQKP